MASSKPCFTTRRTCSSFAAVPKSAKTSASAADKTGEPSFEDALKQLEAVVEEMESDELPLESMLTQKNAAGELELQPFPLEDEAAEPTPQ